MDSGSIRYTANGVITGMERTKNKRYTTSMDMEQHSEKRTIIPKELWKRLLLIVAALIFLFTSSIYAIALWYQHSEAGKPYELGVSFSAPYARALGLDPHEAYTAVLDDLGVKHLRLMSYWSENEPTAGKYDFSELDWQLQEAANHGATVSLAIGLRQPRWPECHAPTWVDISKPKSEWQPALEKYMSAVINRYKASKTIVSYQLENEYFNTFGNCPDRSRDRLASELKLVHQLDPSRPVIISRSNNYAGFAIRPPRGDINGISLYRRVWDSTITKRYFTYPFPSWHYAFLAGVQKLLFKQESVIHELQTEPWPADGKFITEVSLDEQNKTFDAARLKANVAFAKQTGIRHIDLWGAEYWYYRQTKLHDPSVWVAAQHIFKD